MRVAVHRRLVSLDHVFATALCVYCCTLLSVHNASIADDALSVICIMPKEIFIVVQMLFW